MDSTTNASYNPIQTWTLTINYGGRAHNDGFKGARVSNFFEKSLDEVGWYKGNSKGSKQDVATKKPNKSGIHDMRGNVWEWCLGYDYDYGNSSFFPDGPNRPVKGGAWNENATECKSSSLKDYRPDEGQDNLGFRIARTIQ